MGAARNWVERPLGEDWRRSVNEELDLAAAEFGEREWLRFFEGDVHGFAAVRDAVETLARGFEAIGIEAGDRVALFAANRIEFVEAWFAVQRLGAIVVPMNTSHRGLMLTRMLERAEVAAVVCEGSLAANVAPALAGLGSLRAYVAIDGEAPALAAAVRSLSLAELAAIGAEAEAGERGGAPWQGPPSEPAAIMFTSGTTGPSKGVVWTRRSTWFYAETARHALELGAEDTFYCCLPLFHTAALCCGLLASLIGRGRIAIRGRFSVSGFWPDVVAAEATASAMLGAMTPLLLGADPVAEESEHRLRVVNVAPATRAFREATEERFGFHLISGYGLTDFGVLIWHQPGERTPPGSCGRPSRGYECALLDADGFEAGPDEAGELAVRPTLPGIAPAGYWRDPEATLASYGDLWFHTGDLMTRDRDGFFYFVDRAKDAMRRRGENVSSFEVEEAFLTHPEVTDAAAYAIPSELSEDEIAVAVVLAPRASATAADLVGFVEPLLPYFAVPRFVRLLEALPMTPTEKVRKPILREEGAAAGTWDREAERARG